MTDSPFEPYDQAAYEAFCADLVEAGFSPKPGHDRQVWFGPMPAFLQSLTAKRYLEVWFTEGWPFRYARPVVDGLHLPHSAGGTICLWNEDDPAQVVGRTYGEWLARLQGWAAKVAGDSFGPEDQAVDSFMAFMPRNDSLAEMPLAEMVAPGTNGYRKKLSGAVRHRLLQVSVADLTSDHDEELLGMLFLRSPLVEPPSSLSHLKSLLTRKQLVALEDGLARRNPVGLLEPSGGLDFIVLAWPRADGIHDAVAVGFSGAGDVVVGSGFRVAPNDPASVVRRAGPDFAVLQERVVLVVGAGSVGGHVATQLAASGVGCLRILDGETLQSINIVRHVCGADRVGENKAEAVAALIERDTSECDVLGIPDRLALVPSSIRNIVHDFSMVVDCTGSFAVAGALATECATKKVPLVSVALFHQGALLRVRRQAKGDDPIAERHLNPQKFAPVPAEDPLENALGGFLELGCGAPVNNAPPTSVAAAAIATSSVVIDFLTGRQLEPSEKLTVLRPLAEEPFNTIGPVRPQVEA